MPARVLLAILLLALASVVWWIFAPPATTDAVAAPGDNTSTTPAQHVAAGDDASADQPQTLTRDELHNSAASTGAGRVVLRGRCVREPDETPAVGVRVDLRVDVSESYFLQTLGRAAQVFAAIPPVTSGPDGRFEITVDMPVAEVTVYPRAHAPWASSGESIWLDVTEAEEVDGRRVIDIGWIWIEKGYPVRGMVVDQQGRPVDEDALALGVTVPLRGGRFDFGRLPAGEYEPSMFSQAEVVAPREIVVGPGRDCTDLRIVIHRPPALRGTVLDAETREPVPGFVLTADLPDEDQANALTDAQGRFVIRGLELTQVHARIRRTYFDGDVRQMRLVLPEATTQWYRLPHDGLVLLAAPWPELRLKVRRGGRPVTENLRVVTTRAWARFEGHDPDGVTRWTGVPPEGKSLIRVQTTKRPYARSEWFEVEPAKVGDAPVTVELIESQEFVVAVAVPDKGIDRRRVYANLLGAHGLLTSARLGKDDCIRLAATPKLAGLKLVIRGVPVTVRRTLTAAEEKDRRIQVKLVVPDKPKLATLTFVRAGGSGRPVNRHLWHRFLEVRMAGERVQRSVSWNGYVQVPPGTVQVLRKGTSEVLATVAVKPKEKKQVRIAIPGLGLGGVTGTARSRGRILANTILGFVSDDDSHLPVTVDAHGQFGPVHLPAGRYRVHRWAHAVRGVDSDRLSWFDAVVTVAAGADLTVDLDMRREVALRFERPDGRPAADCWLQLSDFGQVRTDRQGRCVLLGLPRKIIRVETKAVPDQPTWRATLDPTGKASTGPFTVRLRESR